mmetsp:Transcript_28915/g.66209  ORF Transcript_28915/g.66209 Transcript_28915/m.66209 type:complete len:219 (+) Transcript_28915:317-973(+)
MRRGTSKECFYNLLSVSSSATASEIKLSYRRLALALHPDRNGGDRTKTDRFRMVTDAYDILVDSVSRSRYDRENGINKPQVQTKSGFSTHPGAPPPGMTYRPVAPPTDHTIMDYKEWYRMHYGGGFYEKAAKKPQGPENVTRKQGGGDRYAPDVGTSLGYQVYGAPVSKIAENAAEYGGRSKRLQTEFYERSHITARMKERRKNRPKRDESGSTCVIM